MVRNPVFKEEEIERLRQQYLDSLSVGMNSPGQLASWVASRVVFGDSPYGHPVSGTTASVGRIQRKDVADFHGRFYRPDNAVLVLGGDIKAEDAYKLAERLDLLRDLRRRARLGPLRQQLARQVGEAA